MDKKLDNNSQVITDDTWPDDEVVAALTQDEFDELPLHVQMSSDRYWEGPEVGDLDSATPQLFPDPIVIGNPLGLSFLKLSEIDDVRRDATRFGFVVDTIYSGEKLRPPTPGSIIKLVEDILIDPIALRSGQNDKALEMAETVWYDRSRAITRVGDALGADIITRQVTYCMQLPNSNLLMGKDSSKLGLEGLQDGRIIRPQRVGEIDTYRDEKSKRTAASIRRQIVLAQVITPNTLSSL